MISADERIATNEQNLDDERYYHEGGFLLRQEVYCSYGIENKVETIAEKTGIHNYKGNLELVSLEDFRNYLALNQAFCIEVLPLNNNELYGDVKKALSWSSGAESMIIYKK